MDITVRDDLALIAVQGPHAQEKVQSLLTEAQRQVVSAMKPFYGVAWRPVCCNNRLYR